MVGVSQNFFSPDNKMKNVGEVGKKLCPPELPRYELLGWSLVSVDMFWNDEKQSKDFKHHSSSWLKNPICRSNASGYAVITGSVSGMTAIDIDDCDQPHNQEIIEMLTPKCMMIARTQGGGKHFVFKYDPRIKTTQDKSLKLDARNDGGLLFVYPSQFKLPSGEVRKYEWEIEPQCEEELTEIPEEFIEYVERKWKGKYVKANEIVQEAVVPMMAQPQTDGAVAEPKEEANSLLGVVADLPNKCFEEYGIWLSIGMVFHNVGLPCSAWEKLSVEKYARYKNGSKRDCAEKWRSFGKDYKGRKMTGASLWALLKKENPSAFYARMEMRNDFWTLITLLNHKDIAEYFYNINPDAYVWHEVQGWYSLENNNTWKHYEKSIPSRLKHKLADTMMTLAMDTKKAELARYMRESSIERDPIKQRELTKKHDEAIKFINGAYKAFGSSEMCNGVISFLNAYYEKADLDLLMDANKSLFAFTDGLYDGELGAFRPIQPHDYISTTTGYAYPKTKNEAVRKEIMTLFYNIFENEETKTYLLRVFASCIFGGNRWEEVYILNGVGGNGKGVASDLLETTLGDYFYTADMALFTKSAERKDQPIPALVEARCKRVLMLTEPENEDTMKTGIIKKLSGGDKVECRTLYSKNIVRYVPMFKPFLQTNTIPNLSSLDGGIQRRIVVIKFPFQFVSKEKMVRDFHRLGDPDVKNKKCKSAEWRDEFMLILTEIYTQIKDWKSLPRPNSINEATGDYIDANNTLKEWLEKHYEITRNEKDYIGANDLKNDYVNDMRIERKDVPSPKKFKELLLVNQVFNKRTAKGNVYCGIKRKETNNEEENEIVD